MAKQFNASKYYNFVLADRELAARGGQYSFNSYTDTEGAYTGTPGSAAMYVTSKDDRGRDQGKYFNLSQQHYVFRVREGEKDTYQRSQFEFLKNHPGCQDSPNGSYLGEGDDRIQLGIIFKLLDTEGDAKFALEIAKRKTQAEVSVFELDDETLKDMAAHIGEFGAATELMRTKVYQWAGTRPADYFEVLNSGERAIRAVVRKALSEGIFKKSGEIIKWEGTLIGGNEDDAVSNLMRQKDILEALQKKMGLSNEVKLRGKPGPKTAIAK